MQSASRFLLPVWHVGQVQRFTLSSIDMGFSICCYRENDYIRTAGPLATIADLQVRIPALRHQIPSTAPCRISRACVCESYRPSPVHCQPDVVWSVVQSRRHSNRAKERILHPKRPLAVTKKWLFSRIRECPKDAQVSGSLSADRLRPALSASAHSFRSLGGATAGRVPSRRLRGRSDGGENKIIKLDTGFDPPGAETNRPATPQESRFWACGALSHTHRFC